MRYSCPHDEAITTPFPPGPRKTGADTWTFSVWAPKAKTMVLELPHDDPGLVAAHVMEPAADGYWTVSIPGLSPGRRYQFRINSETVRPDPASHHQPDDVHGPSALVDHDGFAWTDDTFRPPSPDAMVIYELHVGCFTDRGTFDAALERLDHVAGLGATAVEVMPVAQFPGCRNWGYDGTYLYSVADCYGGPEGFKRFVDGCHVRGLSVILDVVYNHLGPEGNYLRDFGPYFTNRYKTPWGEAVNFDGPDSDPVNDFFLWNALHWFDRYHVDGLRLDATHAIYDQRPSPFLRRLSLATQSWGESAGRSPLLIAENDMNDPRLTLPAANWGAGMDGVWSDDFHHAMHALLTGERKGYYVDFGEVDHLCDAMNKGFCYTGQYSPFRKRAQGADPSHMRGREHVACIQNHDQVGNRMQGERLTELVSTDACKVAAGLLLLAPLTPLLFMGEEYGETNPFLYYISHLDAGLVEAVRKGRKREFKSFKFKGDPPDPAGEETFKRSTLDWSKLQQEHHRDMLAFYTECLRLRRETPALATPDLTRAHASPVRGTKALVLLRRSPWRSGDALILANMGPSHDAIPAAMIPQAPRRVALATHDSIATTFPIELPGFSLAVMIDEQEQSN